MAAVGHTPQPVPRAGLGRAGLTASARKPCQWVRISGAVLGSAGWATGRQKVCSSPFVCTFPLVPPALCRVALGEHCTSAHAVLGKSRAGQHDCVTCSLLLTGAGHWRKCTSVQAFQKVVLCIYVNKNDTPYTFDPPVLLLSVYPKERYVQGCLIL